jgi:hypothetical protein
MHPFPTFNQIDWWAFLDYLVKVARKQRNNGVGEIWPILLEELVTNYSNCQQIMGSLLFVGIDVFIPST